MTKKREQMKMRRNRKRITYIKLKKLSLASEGVNRIIHLPPVTQNPHG
jgi:hypothetical protein